MAKESTPEGQVRRWVRGVLAQADKDIAATTLAVLWNASALGGGPAAGRHFASAPLSSLLREPFAALGSSAPDLDAALAAHATLGLLSDCLWQQVQPTRSRGRARHDVLPRRGEGLTRSWPMAPQANSSGTQLGARFSMKASIPSRGSGDSARAQNIVW